MTNFSYKNPLDLTTPLASGPRVKEAQKLMAGQGKVLKRKCYTGKIDGQYGEQSAHGARSSKFWLGYTNRKIDGVFGETLYEYLTGKKKQNLYMKWLVNRRLRQEKKSQQTGGLYKKAIDEAVKFLGVKESPPGSNRQEFGVWYGMNGEPWCAIFVSYILSHVGRPFRYSYCPAIVSDARLGRNKLRIIPFSQVAGAIKNGHPVLALFDWSGNGVAEHVGFVDKIISSSEFEIISGNTGTSNFSNGGEVMRGTFTTGVVCAFVLVYP